jgi:hypothetical protein
MSDDNDNSFDDPHAQAVYDVAREAKHAEEAAKEFVRKHDIVTALSIACDKLDERSISCTVPHSENSDSGTVIGISVGRHGSVQVHHKTVHGSSRRELGDLSPDKLKGTVRVLAGDSLGSAAEEEVSEAASDLIEAGEAIPNGEVAGY